MYDEREIINFVPKKSRNVKVEKDTRCCGNCAKSIRHKSQSYVDANSGSTSGCGGCSNLDYKGDRLKKWVSEEAKNATE